MFWNNFVMLCAQKNVKPNPVAKELGISSGAVTKWKKEGTTPNEVTLQKIAKYFNVTVSYLLSENVECENKISDFEYTLIMQYRSHPEHHTSINSLLGISPETPVSKLQFDTKPVFIAAASGNEHKATEPDIKTIIEIENAEQKHNK